MINKGIPEVSTPAINSIVQLFIFHDILGISVNILVKKLEKFKIHLKVVMHTLKEKKQRSPYKQAISPFTDPYCLTLRRRNLMYEVRTFPYIAITI